MAQEMANCPHVSLSAVDIARGDHQFGFTSLPPEVFQEERLMREIPIHRDHERSGGGGETGTQRGAESSVLRRNNVSAQPLRHSLRSVSRSAVYYKDLSRK